ncbi:hypothetical protein Tco_0902348 [Tanacetum coccineum]
MVPQALLTKSGLVYVNSHKRLFQKKTPNYNRYFNRSVNSVKDTRVHTARPKTKVNTVKASASWVWKPKQEVIDHVSKSNNASKTLTRYDYVDAYGRFKTTFSVINGFLNVQAPIGSQIPILKTRTMNSCDSLLKTIGLLNSPMFYVPRVEMVINPPWEPPIYVPRDWLVLRKRLQVKDLTNTVDSRQFAKNFLPLPMIHVLKVENGFSPPWIIPFLGANGLTSPRVNGYLGRIVRNYEFLVPTGSTQFLLVVRFSLPGLLESPGLMESIKRHYLVFLVFWKVLVLWKVLNDIQYDEEDAILMEERLLVQKAKIDWLKLGDANTAYFNKMVKSQTSRNRIDSIVDNNDATIDGDQAVHGRCK